MSDNTYRLPVKSEPSPKESTVYEKEKSVTLTGTEVEPPYSEYEKKNGKPYPVEYFDLGSFWNTGDLYTKEVDTISTYINHLIATGELNNSIESVKTKLKSMEKMINSKPDDRKAARVGMLAAHIDFLLRADNIKRNAAKYSMI